MTSLDLESNSRPGKNVERQTDEFLSEIVQSGINPSVLLDDEEAARFLFVKTVESKLKPGLAVWLERLFGFTGDEELRTVLAMQRHVGEVQ